MTLMADWPSSYPSQLQRQAVLVSRYVCSSCTHSQERLHSRILLLALQPTNGLKLALKLGGLTRHIVRFVAGDGDDTADTLGNRGDLGDDEVLDGVGLLNMSICQPLAISGQTEASERSNIRSTAELNRGRRPLVILDILLDILQREANRNHPHRIRVRLAKDGTQPRDLLGHRKGHLFRVHRRGLFDPLVRDVFNLDQLIRGRGVVMRKVESQLGRRDERAFLVDMVAEDFAQGEVENMGAGVIVANGPSAKLPVSSRYVARQTSQFDVPRRRSQ